ncbi:hypothetical protein DDZ13_04785 [Coraliomargarita sinensis]|uniref:Uncharacterized protein n=1 Tax=Coraliomargarita sinensis TaxID=2174842 RepID=A0A317ZFV6_9BACT|nr:hypothetical protein DDZ13_04785 [Coraliomargarita sinensis]
MWAEKPIVLLRQQGKIMIGKTIFLRGRGHFCPRCVIEECVYQDKNVLTPIWGKLFCLTLFCLNQTTKGACLGRIGESIHLKFSDWPPYCSCAVSENFKLFLRRVNYDFHHKPVLKL